MIKYIAFTAKRKGLVTHADHQSLIELNPVWLIIVLYEFHKIILNEILAKRE